MVVSKKDCIFAPQRYSYKMEDNQDIRWIQRYANFHKACGTMRFGLSDNVIRELQEIFRRHANIKKVLIFGSRSKGNYRSGSDIDLAVIGNDIDYNQLLTISCEIDELELLYSIDLLDYGKKAGTPIGDHIARVGQVFYEAA